jgi:acyl carrier protein
MDITRTIKDVLVSEVFVEVPPEKMNEADNLRHAYGLDSIGFSELRVQCEERFGITIPDDEFNVDNFSTIGSVVALVERHMAAGRAGSATAERP